MSTNDDIFNDLIENAPKEDVLAESRVIFNSVIESYPNVESIVPKMLNALLNGETYKYGGLVFSAPRDNRKVTVCVENKVPPFLSMYVNAAEIDIPVRMFTYEMVSALWDTEQLNAVEINNRWKCSRVRFYTWNNDTKDWNIFQQFEPKHFLWQLYILCGNSARRADWESKLSTLHDRPNYRINVKLGKKVNGLVHMPDEYLNFIKEEHASKGFYAVKTNESGVAINGHDGTIVSFEDPKKANARQSRLVDCPDPVCMGKHRSFFVIDQVPDELSDMFVTGSGYVSRKLIERVGAFRAVNDHLLKMTSMVMPAQMEEEFTDEIVLSSSSFKGGINELYRVHHDLEPNVMPLVSLEKVQEWVNEATITRKVMGVEVQGFHINMPLEVTHFFSLFGLRRVKDEPDSELDIERDVYDLEEHNSLFVEIMDIMREDSNFDLIQYVRTGIEEGKFKYKPQVMSVKTQEIVNAYFSYGKYVGYEWLKAIMTKSVKPMKSAQKEVLDYLTGNLDDQMVEVPQAYLERFITLLYEKRKISPGVIDPDLYGDAPVGRTASGTPIYAEDAVNGLLNGTGEWDGLLGDKPKYFMYGEHKLYIPSGKVMKQFIFNEEGSNRIFLNGPASAFQMLLISIRSKKTDKMIKTVQHYVDLQRALLGSFIDSFYVHGCSNKTILPGYWMKRDEIATLDEHWTGRKNNRVAYSKMPVLFNKAVSDVKLLCNIPEDIFGEVNDRLRFAMRNMLFVNVDLQLDHQNDTDGDIGRIIDVGGILPLYDGLPKHMSTWSHIYADGERDLELKYKNYKIYARSRSLQMDMMKRGIYVEDITISDAVKEAKQNKEDVGKLTNALFTLSHILQMYVHREVISFESAQIIRDAYAMGVQEIVQGIKHDKGALVLDADMRSMLYVTGEDGEVMLNARSAFADLIDQQCGADLSQSELRAVLLDLSKMFAKFDKDSELYNGSPLSYRRTVSLSKVPSFKECQLDAEMKLLDIMTASYLRCVEQALPAYNHPDSDEVYAKIRSSFSEFCSKYLLLGQNLLEVNRSTTVSDMLHYWDAIR